MVSSDSITGLPSSDKGVGDECGAEETDHEGHTVAPSESLQESLSQAWVALSNLASTVATKVNS